MLVLEQAEDANSVSSGAGDTNRQTAWQRLKPVLPILLVCSLLLLESVTLRLWLEGRLASWDAVLRLLLAAVAPFLALVLGVGLPLALARLPIRWTRLPKRTLRLDEKGIKLSQTTPDRVRWQGVRRWFLAPVLGNEELASLTVECGSATGAARRYWNITLNDREQEHALLSELEHLRQIGRTSAPVLRLSQPPPGRNVALKGFWTLALAFFLFIHGFPLLLVGLVPHDSSGSKDPQADSELSPKGRARLERLMLPVVKRLHLRNEKQLRMLFWIPGALLTGGAIGCYAWASRQQSRQLTELNRRYDLEVEKITEVGGRDRGRTCKDCSKGS